MADSIESAEALTRLGYCAAQLGGISARCRWAVLERLGIAVPAGATRLLSELTRHEVHARLVHRLGSRQWLPLRPLSAVASLRIVSKVEVVEGPDFGATTVVYFGRQRTRLVSRSSGRSTVIDQPGCSTVVAELAAREWGDASLLPRVLDADATRGLLVEEVLSGANLAVEGATSEILELLDRWRGTERRTVTLGELVVGMRAGSETLQSLGLHEAQEVELAPSHGDLIPANVMRLEDGSLRLVDLERFEWRWVDFDEAYLRGQILESPLAELERRRQLERYP